MTLSLPNWSRLHLIFGLLIALVVGAGYANLSEYLIPNLNLILVGIAAPFVLRVRQKGQYSHRYGVLAVGSLLIFAGVHMQIFFLLAVGASIAYLVESCWGKMGILPLVLLVLMSPVPAYLAEIATFPLRLWMSEQIAVSLSSIGTAVTHSGNMFTVNGHEFAVDEACMGLQSLVTGLVMTTLLIAFTEQRQKRILAGWISILLLAMTLVLVILGNFVRMISLVLFQSAPETLSHELIGILGLLIYVVLPMAVMTRLVIQKWGRKESKEQALKPRFAWVHLLTTALLIGGIGYFNLNRSEYRNFPQDLTLSNFELSGFEKTVLKNGITKFEQEHVLVYLKPPVRFWGSDHSPNICWRASGFRLHRVTESLVGPQQIYTAELRKESDVLYTAWWYDNGSMQTHSQLEWRIQRIQGAAPFRLVNVTATDPDRLYDQCRRLLAELPIAGKP